MASEDTSNGGSRCRHGVDVERLGHALIQQVGNGSELVNVEGSMRGASIKQETGVVSIIAGRFASWMTSGSDANASG